MIKVLIKLLGTIGLSFCYLIWLCIVSVWSMQYKKVTTSFILEIMSYWNISMDDLRDRAKDWN